LNVYLDAFVGLKTVQFHVSRNFPERPARRLIPFLQFWVPGEGTAWRHIPSR